ITIDLSAMISETMSRISSRAATWSMVASWERSIESISALKIADLVWWYSLSRAIASGLRTSTTSALACGRLLSGAGRGAAAGSGRAAAGAGLGVAAVPAVLPPKLVRLPNMRLPSGLLELLEKAGQRQIARLAGHFRQRAAGHVQRDRPVDIVAAIIGGHLGNHLPVIGRRAEDRRIERDLAQQPGFDRGGEFLGGDLRPARHADLVDHQQRLGFRRPECLERIGQVLGIE